MLYSPFKASHQKDRIDALKRKEIIYPTQVQIDLTNRCCNECRFCFYRCARNESLNALFNENDAIPFDRMVRLLDEFKALGIPAVQYTGGGEPFMYPGIYDIIAHTVELGLEYAIVSNGCAINVDRVKNFKDATWIRISLDAASPYVYSESQGVKKENFFHVLKVIEALVKECPKTTIGVSFVVNPINYTEIVTAAKLVKSMGVNNIRYSVAYTPKGIELYRDNWAEIEKLCHEAKRLQSDTFKVFNLAVAHLENLDLRQKGYTFCGYQHFTAVIGADQNVYPCCTLKYRAKTNFGCLKDKTFEEVWKGEVRRKWLEMDHLKLVCDKNPCWFDSKNAYIGYLLEEDPPHVNYI